MSDATAAVRHYVDQFARGAPTLPGGALPNWT